VGLEELSFVAQAGRNHDRVRAAIGVAAIHALLGYALVTGLVRDAADAVGETLKVFDVAAQLPPPPVAEIAPARAEESEGAASPPNLRADPAPIVAPPPAVRLEVPSPVVAAPVPGPANDPSAGAANIVGPGTGSGGLGTGTGSGAAGSGTGGGRGRPSEQISGSLSGLFQSRRRRVAPNPGSTSVRYIVEANGRVTGCGVTRASGDAILDAEVCQLIEQRFIFRPATDAQGRFVRDIRGGTYVWFPRGS